MTDSNNSVRISVKDIHPYSNKYFMFFQEDRRGSIQYLLPTENIVNAFRGNNTPVIPFAYRVVRSEGDSFVVNAVTDQSTLEVISRYFSGRHDLLSRALTSEEIFTVVGGNGLEVSLSSLSGVNFSSLNTDPEELIIDGINHGMPIQETPAVLTKYFDSRRR
jgi:hypothetical protein